MGLVQVGSVRAALASDQDFDQQIAPLIAQRCLSCHSGAEPKGKLDLSSQTTAMTGGESGKVIVPGDLDDSLLWEQIDTDEMPPKKPLPAAEKALLKDWIASGAKWGTETIDPFRFTTDARAGFNWWSLQPLVKREPPSIQRAGWTQNPIDAFVFARLTAAGLAPSAEADKRTLIRRLTFDLLGLPPTTDQIQDFLADTSEGAYGKLVDRLLESPHYGERWARHWLDVVRFGESNGFEYDQPRNNAWYYRNWVITALNQDMPYDEFVQLQLAGDVLLPKDPQAIAASGFLVAGAHNTTLPSSQKMRMTMAQDELEDLVGVVGQTFLGLTVNCARCHDHKFDPISQKEYYQLAATLAGVNHGERTVQVVTSPKLQQRVVEIDALVTDLRKKAPIGKNNAQLKMYTCVSKNPGVTKLLRRGNVADPGEDVSPAGLRAVPGVDPDFGVAPNASDADRRKKLAEWVTHRDNPLFARVIVNRLWHYHFGRGLVTTPNDFGYNGGTPSHPALLDWLAEALRRHEYRLKPIHRLIVTSATYRQSSKPNVASAKIDADNRLLWRKSPQRLEAESIRDAVLLVAGKLDTELVGKGYRDVRHFSFKGSNFYETLAETGTEKRRRTIYRFSPRGGRNPFLDTFDCPDPSTTAPQRAQTTTPLQALALMNNALIFQMADMFAERVMREAGQGVEQQVALMIRLAYGRAAGEDEIQRANGFVKEYGLPALGRVVFNSNEFVFVQ